jgi:hypothetical protein
LPVVTKEAGAKSMAKTFLFWLLASVLLITVSPAEPQQSGKIFRIGYLSAGGSGPPEAFRQGLRDLGYVEGKNIIFEYRTSGEKVVWSTDRVAELVRLNVTSSSLKERGRSELLRMPAQQYPL